MLVLDKLSAQCIKENPIAVAEIETDFNRVFFQVDLSEYKAERHDIKVLESAQLYFSEIMPSNSTLRPVLISDA